MYGMFSLTRREQIVVIFILLALVSGAAIRHFRLSSMVPSQSTNSSPAKK